MPARRISPAGRDRRGGRRTGAAAPALALLAMLAPATAPAEGLSRRDKLGALYSNRLSFDARGVPIVTVAIREGARQAVIGADGGPPRLLPDGNGGAVVSGPSRWRVTLDNARPAKVAYFVALARAPVRAHGAIKRARAAWKGRGVEARILEVGKIVAVAGRVLDNRALVLAEGPFPSAARARAVARRRREQGPLPRHTILPRLERRPSARLVVGQGVRVTAHDAVWFAPPPGGRLRIGGGAGKPGRPYFGGVYVTVGPRGDLVVVNEVAADRLLEGLVPAEIFPSAPAAALRAQAVAARGELFRKTGTRHFVDPFLLCARTHCQVYAGAGHEHPRTSAAVAATRGLVLAEPDGRVVDTVYSAVCGGHTEDNDAVWPAPADPVLRGHLDAPAGVLAPFRAGITSANLAAWLETPRRATWCGRSGVNERRYRWRRRLDAVALARGLTDLRVGPIRAIEVLRRGRSGRATAVAIVGALGRRTIEGELRIRRRLGNLPSSMFVVTPVRDAGGAVTAFDVRGGGWGHGVGMCQSGAIGMAKAGRRFRAILRHYYPGSRLLKVY